jgi:lysophospholipase
MFVRTVAAWTATCLLVSSALALPSPAPSDDDSSAYRAWHTTELMPWCEGEAREGSFVGVDGATIRYAAFTTPGARDALVLASGRTEFWKKYCEVVLDLQGEGFDIFLVDHRGQGASDRLLADPDKGYVLEFSHYVDDLRALFDQVVVPMGHDRRFLLGHSMGGAIATHFAVHHGQLIDGLVLSAPMMQINADPYPEWLTRWMVSFLDWIGQGESYAPGKGPRDPSRPFADNGVTQSYARWAASEGILAQEPGLGLGGVTNRWLKESLEATQYIDRRADDIPMPTLLLQAAKDGIVLPGRQDDFCARSPSCTKVVMQDGMHEMLMERDDVRSATLDAITSFLDALR